ncbi:MAG: tetratricopeptide repeat protein [Candidatus Eremiobacteraeota bacterium]|nr:tetratricopeptide repeat protein [Candidatus Eremiobacteraeota bacterium]
MPLRSRSLPFAFVLVAVCCAYANHFGNGFHFDDSHAVVHNPYVRNLHNAVRFFTDATTFSVVPANQSYRPIVTLSLALDYALGGGYRPFWFQLSTFVVFLAQLGAMFAFLGVLLERVRPDPRNRFVAALATALYGLHPAIAETVNYVIQRADVYSTCGVVAAFALYARFPQARRRGFYLIPLALALLSKPPAVVFPALLGLYVLWFEPRGAGPPWRAALRAAAPSAVLCVLYVWLASAMTPKSFAAGEIPAWSYDLTQPFVWLRYFGAFFLPVRLNADSDLGAFAGINAAALAGFAFVAALAAIVWATAREARLRPIAFGVAWFAIASLPTSLYPLAEVENDHRMYFPFVGLALAVAWAAVLALDAFAGRVEAGRLNRGAVGLAIVVLAAYGFGVHQRNEVWRSDESLWYDVTIKSPTNGRGLMNYGLSQMEAGRYATALSYFERAALYRQNYGTLEINLGIASGALGKRADAERHFLRAIELVPADGESHYFYGRWLGETGRPADAIAEYRRASAVNPALVEARRALMLASLDEGDLTDARREANALLAFDPNDADARRTLTVREDAAFWIEMSHRRCGERRYRECIAAAREALRRDRRAYVAYHNLGAAYGGLELWNEALDYERAALRIAPHYAPAEHDRALYAAQARLRGPKTAGDFLAQSFRYDRAGDYRRSIEAARAALALRPRYAEAYNNIAAGYAGLAMWDDAAVAATQALRLAPGYQLAKNNLAWALREKAAAAKRPAVRQ